MAVSRGFSWGAFFMGAVALLVLLIAVAAIIIFGGFYPIAASEPDPPGGVAWILGTTMDHAVERRSAGLKAPSFSAADIREGGSNFKGMCQRCHGGPGAPREDFAQGLNPPPPNLAESTDDMPLEQVFWIAKHGIKMSAMPAFGKTDSDEELWKIAAFVKQMSTLTPQQYAAIPSAREGTGKAGNKGSGD